MRKPDPYELRMGIEVELEHTDDREIARKIALDHLAEHPNYYTVLKSVGLNPPPVGATMSLFHKFDRLRSAANRTIGGTFLVSTGISYCDQANKEHADSDRQYMHTGHKYNTVCCATATHELTTPWIVGLLVHELGHLILGGPDMRGPRHTEQEANEAGEAATGIKVVFKGPKHLEWSDPREYDRVIRR